MENKKSWLLIADASSARLFAVHKAKILSKDVNDLELLCEFSHPESRLKNKDLTSDKQGEFGASTFTEATSPKEREALVFAHELLAKLDSGRVNNQCKEIIIFAPPAFMGLLNKNMKSETRRLVSLEVEKDYSKQAAKELINSLISHL